MTQGVSLRRDLLVAAFAALYAMIIYFAARPPPKLLCA